MGWDGIGKSSKVIIGLLSAPSVLISNGVQVTFNFFQLAGSFAESNTYTLPWAILFWELKLLKDKCHYLLPSTHRLD